MRMFNRHRHTIAHAVSALTTRAFSDFLGNFFCLREWNRGKISFSVTEKFLRLFKQMRKLGIRQTGNNNNNNNKNKTGHPMLPKHSIPFSVIVLSDGSKMFFFLFHSICIISKKKRNLCWLDFDMGHRDGW